MTAGLGALRTARGHRLVGMELQARYDIISYHNAGGGVTDLLIRNVPDDVMAAIEASAKRLGLSRSEYLRRQLAREAAVSAEPVTVEDLSWFAATFADLSDPNIMAQAWE